MRNPFDIRKDGINSITDGICYHIRESEQNKQNIKQYINEHLTITSEVKPLLVLDYILKELGLTDNDLTITDEHELIDYIYSRVEM